MVVLRNTADKYSYISNAYRLLVDFVYCGISYYYIEFSFNAKYTK